MGAAFAQLKDYRNADRALRQEIGSNPDDAIARFNLGVVCLARQNRDCALTQYNYLKILEHSLAKTLFTSISTTASWTPRNIKALESGMTLI